MKELFFATGNEDKARELEVLTKDLNIKILTLKDFPGFIAPEETGTTFLENAFIKSRAASDFTGLPALADDSGLVVPALDGAPGVYSARYSGMDATAEENNNKLLNALEDVAYKNRQAQFKSTLALTLPNGEEYYTEGVADGMILRKPQGENGFGYDPIFFVPSYNRSMAELSMDEKNAISHRGEALRKIENLLKSLFS